MGKYKPKYLSKSMTIDLNNVTNEDAADLPVSDATQAALNTKQAVLISGVNLKTVNGVDLLGSGDVPAGGGSVTTVSVVTANGISGTVANDTTTPAITLALGAINPSSVNSTFTGALTGNVTGNCSGSSGSCTGNAATATTASACSGNAATATTASACSGNSATATTAGACSGNSATATTLATPRTINGVSFNGSANIQAPFNEVSNTLSANYTLAANSNGLIAAPLTITPGISLTIPSGSTLRILHYG